MNDDNLKHNGLSPLKQAFLALEEAEAKLAAAEGAKNEPIAIIGIGCRFPGRADSPEAFWENLRAGRDAIAEVPPERWEIARYYDPDPEAPGKMATRWGGFIEAVDRFDAERFGITPREARSMDPQQRLLMEVAWEALANAGHADLEELEGSATGVFVGIASDDYAHLQMEAKGLAGIDTYFVSGAARSIASGRLAYCFGLHGPAVSVDTACSSSLLAVHQACGSLKDGECRMALAAGVNLILSPANTVALTKYQMMAPDGRCKAFDAAADGFVRGEGCGVVVLKRLQDALADRDPIHALILGSAANQDGPSSGLTVPNGPAQEAVIRAALARARLNAAQVDYIEAHGTGTALGDPIEVRALGACFADQRPPGRPLLIGSVKTNIGHLEAAAGIAGLIKAALVLQHREIPPSLHYKRPNPNIDWQAGQIRVAAECTPLGRNGGPLHAGVTALGFSGTNVHVVLAGPPDDRPARDRIDRPLHVITLSARSESLLREDAAELARKLAADGSAHPADIGFTLALGRTHERHRLAVAVETTQELTRELGAFAAGAPGCLRSTAIAEGAPEPRVAFLFTGQGARYAGMGRSLYERHPVMRDCIDRCDEMLQPLLGSSLRAALFPDPVGAPVAYPALHAGPALFVLEYALSQLWLAWGVRPAWVLGHGLGEITAACTAGVLSLPDALTMVVARARAMQAAAADGEMWAILAPEHRVAGRLAGDAHAVSIAAVNGPRQVVIAGRAGSVRAVSRSFLKEGITAIPLAVSPACPSPLMEPALDRFEAAIAGIQFRRPRLALISSAGTAAGEEIAGPAYWSRHLRSPVRFMEGMQTLAAQGCRLFVEIGPQPVLSGLAQEFLNDPGMVWLPSLEQGTGEWRGLLHALGELYLAGVAIDWTGFDAPFARRRIALPGPGLDRRRYWFSAPSREAAENPADGLVTKEAHPLLARRIDSASGRVLFRATLGSAETAFFADHRVAGGAALPLAAVLEAAAAAVRRIGGNAPAVKLGHVRMDRAIEIPAGTAVELEWAFDPDGAGGYRFQLFSRKVQEAWMLNAAGTAAGADLSGAGVESLPAIRGRCDREVDSAAFYRGFVAAGLDFGPAFKSVQQVRVGRGEAVGRLRPDLVDAPGFDLSPVRLDGALQMVAAAVMDGMERPRLFLPVGVDEVQLTATSAPAVWGQAVLREAPTEQTRSMACDVRLMDEQGRVAALLSGCRLMAVEAAALAAQKGPEDRLLYDIRWSARPERAAFFPAQPLQDAFRPAIAEAAAEAGRMLPEVAARHHLAAYDSELRRLDARVGAYILRALHELGWRPDPHRPEECEALAARLKVAGRHRRLWRRLLDILVEDGVLLRQAGGWVAASDQARVAPALAADDTPLAAIERDLVDRCGSRLAAALRGEVDALDLMYQGDGLDAVTRLYTESVTARVYNHLVAECCARALAGWPNGRALRVLEIGAGTGGTTQAVLNGLSGLDVSYLFTDVSPAFVHAAAQRFSEGRGFAAQTLDIEKAPGAQGLAGRQFDLVVAANVLHATADLAVTLGHVRELTAPGGMLMLLEVTAPQRWIDITFGLTAGWWKFADADLRGDYPLIPAEQWLRLLEAHGFSDAAALPASRSGAVSASLGREAIVLARRTTAQTLRPADREDWLIIADAGGLGDQIAARLGAMGLRSRTAGHAKTDSTGAGTDAPATRDDFDGLLAEMGRENTGYARRGNPAKVLYLRSLDGPGRSGAQEEDDPLKRAAARVAPVLGLLQALADLPAGPPQLILVTRAAQAVGGREPVDPAATLLWGLLRGAMLEHPELRCKLIDIAADAGQDCVSALLDECLAQDAENQVALRASGAFVPRLAPMRAEVGGDAQAEAPGAQRLAIAQRGMLENLCWEALEPPATGPGQVKIAVQASGLNFRDVLNALGMYAGGAVPLGGECAGVVTAVGAGVDTLQPGDRVAAIAAHGFSSEVVTPALLAARIPAALELERAAGLPIAYVTAAHSLEGLAGLRKGQRILIHAAAGGVGLAAVHLARLADAEIFATAGSPEKQGYLRELGVAHVMNSRSLEFAGQVLALTGGRGVDVVLNSLAGEFIERSLAVTAQGGTFIELGRSGILSAGQVRDLRPDVTYHAVDLTGDMEHRPERIAAILGGILARIESGALPLLPCRVFSKSAVIDAFRFMSRAKHIGKIVVAWPRPVVQESAKTLVRSDATYWITGGLGALGLFAAEWLARQGAGHLLLTGRRAPSAAAAARITQIRQKGTRVTVLDADAGSRAAVAATMARLAADGSAPLRGIIHAAGQLDDGILRLQSWPRFEKVMQAKVAGAWHLHQATRHLPLDFFVLYSSVSALLGSLGQTNHCAANAFMDGLAHLRRAVALEHVHRQLERLGVLYNRRLAAEEAL